MLNLFFAVIVDAMQSQAAAAQEQQKRDIELLAEEKEVVLHREMESLRREITELKEILKTQTRQPSAPRSETP